MKYDDASWHSGGNFPKGLPDSAGATHIGMFVAWALMSGLAGDIHVTDPSGAIPKLRARSITPGRFLLEYCDGKFTNEDLNDEGNAFARAYFESPPGPYLADYEVVLGEGLPDLYRVPDTWGNFDRLRLILDRRFAEWKNGGSFSSLAVPEVRLRTISTSLNLQGLWWRVPVQLGVAIAVVLITAWFLSPTLDIKGRQAANEAAAVRTLSRINQLERKYAASHSSQGFACQLSLLKLPLIAGGGGDRDDFLLTGTVSGYKLSIVGCLAGGGGVVTGYQITAVPWAEGSTGVRAFCTDESGALWYDRRGSAEKCLAERESL